MVHKSLLFTIQDVTPITFEELGKKLKEIRGDIDKDVFAESLGISTRTLYRYESGERKVPDGLMKLAEIEHRSKLEQDSAEIQTDGEKLSIDKLLERNEQLSEKVGKLKAKIKSLESKIKELENPHMDLEDSLLESKGR